jgi:hypothetical protein
MFQQACDGGTFLFRRDLAIHARLTDYGKG